MKNFNKNSMKSVKWEHSVPLVVNETYIQFLSGSRRMIGKVVKIHGNGVTTYTEYGYYSPAWEFIQRYFVKKSPRGIKLRRLKFKSSVDSNIPLLDGTMSAIIDKCGCLDIVPVENITDTFTEYSRELIFTNDDRWIKFQIKDKNSPSILVSGSGIRKWNIKPNAKRKITGTQVTNAMKKVASILETLNE